MEGHLLFNKAVTKQINPLPKHRLMGIPSNRKQARMAREKAEGGFVFRGTSGGKQPTGEALL